MLPFTPQDNPGRVLDMTKFTLSAQSLTFSEVENIVPDHPYLVLVSESLTALTGTRGSYETLPTPFTKTVDGAAMYGVYRQISDLQEATGVTTSTPAYVLSGGQFYLVDSQVGIAPFRAYFGANTGSVPVNVLNLFEEDKVDAIGKVEAEATDGPVYNLSGQLVCKNTADSQRLPKGVYISTGKIIIK